MKAYSHLSILREEYGVVPGGEQPLFGTIIHCDLCNKQANSIVALDVEWHYSAEDANKTADVKLCRSCLNKALVRLDHVDDADQKFKEQEAAIIALERAKRENANE